ncbi:class D beta-lactamase [Arundinibacter roseus]|uniref:Beta-lactamase n=1 Tax=Arundinibacter roseus TaxID=2070510 RepID=A0A4V2X9D5_9BACT|nr:class D beta-lactamase [Arundinibacter roseus]TDB63335.1 class D beta-lactamase [Arundinibacter roseus]
MILRIGAYLSLLLLTFPAWAQEKLPAAFDRFFEQAGFMGSFTLYDLQKNTYYTTNLNDFEKLTSPASTFKIPNSLIALETKVVRDQYEVLPWDGTAKWLKTWEKDHDMVQAYKNSTVWFYQEMARRIGEKKYTDFLKKFDYGNQDISSGLTTFWLGESLRISPKNQLDFLKKLHLETFPLSPRTYQIGKELMIEEKTDTYVLRAKTGWADTKPTHTGWYVGYIETKGNVYFFATRLYQPDAARKDNFGTARKSITRSILTELAIL